MLVNTPMVATMHRPLHKSKRFCRVHQISHKPKKNAKHGMNTNGARVGSVVYPEARVLLPKQNVLDCWRRTSTVQCSYMN